MTDGVIEKIIKKYIISDTHFNHESLLCTLPNPRPKDYVQRIFKHLMQLSQDETLYHLGDICIGKDKEMHEKYIMPLKCKKILIRGNHDKKSDNWYLNNGWDFVCNMLLINHNGKEISLSHKPIDNIGDLNIHGHYHNRFDLEIMDGKHILYSAEREHYHPISIDSIIKKDKHRRSNIKQS